jgi:hypothetical protein
MKFLDLDELAGAVALHRRQDPNATSCAARLASRGHSAGVAACDGALELRLPRQDDKKQPMSGNTVNVALRRAGISTREEQTGHDFRAMARTILHKRLGIRRCHRASTAHSVPDPLGTAYNLTKFFEDRRKMMQEWAGLFG